MLAHKSRIYPNPEEERKLLCTLEICQRTYDHLLELYYGGEHDRGKLQSLLPKWKESNEDLRGVHSKALQYELYRLVAHFAALREMKKVRSERSRLKLVDRRPLQPSTNELQADWLKQEASSVRAG